MKAQRHLILGGARSGKTRYALDTASSLTGDEVLYVATAQAHDKEMQLRIDRHRAERPKHWQTLEMPENLARALQNNRAEGVIVVDCLTLWLSNAMLVDFNESDATADLSKWNQERATFLTALDGYVGNVILVSNEVGNGIVPVSALARRFQDEQGWLNQAVAKICEQVTLVVAGIAVPVKR